MKRWPITFALLCLPATAGADALIAPEVSTLRLRSQISAGDPVTLRDVLVLTEADPRLVQEIADQPLFDGADGDRAQVTRDQVDARLRALGVNMARVLLSGPTRCQIEHRAAEPAPAPPAEPAAPLMRHPPPTPSANRAPDDASDATLAHEIERYLTADLAALGGRPLIEFQRGSEEFLTLTTPPWEFRIRPSDGARLGLRTLNVAIMRDQRVHRTARVIVRVRMARQVVVALSPLNVGTFVQENAVGLEERVFDSLETGCIDRIERVVGQQVGEYLAAGRMIEPRQLKRVDLVTRSSPISIVGELGSVSIRTTGIALDSGGYGETVRIRLGDSARQRRDVRGVVTGVGTVKLAGGTP
ncbi:MAG: hypothetical protein CHACPFDD_02500 [Phycisphaerae bacterium]|nr:hypothetical protein [Phycisphaerae bacterium]